MRSALPVVTNAPCRTTPAANSLGAYTTAHPGERSHSCNRVYIHCDTCPLIASAVFIEINCELSTVSKLTLNQGRQKSTFIEALRQISKVCGRG
jgi:hypothetical protein